MKENGYLFTLREYYLGFLSSVSGPRRIEAGQLGDQQSGTRPEAIVAGGALPGSTPRPNALVQHSTGDALMKTVSKIIVATAIVLLTGIVYLGVSIARRGFSAREKPSRFEEFLARNARRIATPAGAKQLKNPYPLTSESLSGAREHWVDHCAICHALDGSGNTGIGQNLYPKAPEMRDEDTQGLSDGELYYIITNGIRFTGMPAWGREHSDEDTWQLVSFIRRLPELTSEELKLLEELERGEGDSAGSKEHQHGPESKPHTH